MNMEGTWRGQLADTWRWAEGAGMGRGQEGTGTREDGKGEGYTDGDRLPPLQPLHPTPPCLHRQVQPCTRSVHPCTLPTAASPRAVPALGFWYFGLRRGWDGAPQGHQGHTELTQPPLTVPRRASTALWHTDAPARCPACPLRCGVQSRAPVALIGLQEGPSGSFVKASTMQ